jgi:hypothetical protein
MIGDSKHGRGWQPGELVHGNQQSQNGVCVFRRYAIVSAADITTAMQRVEAVTLKCASKKIGVKSVKILHDATRGRV